MHRLSLIAVRGATLPCGAWTSYCSGFSCGGARALSIPVSVVAAQALRVWAQWLWCTGLVALQHVASSQTRNKPASPALADGFSSTVPPGKPHNLLLLSRNFIKACQVQRLFVTHKSQTSDQMKRVYHMWMEKLLSLSN